MIFLLSFLSFFCSAKSGDINYGTVVTYAQGEKLKFPDFTLEFTGERSEKKDFEGGSSTTFRFFDFKISNDTESKTISWTAGAGDIAPVDFEIGGAKYQLEMSTSESLKKRLSKNEIVIVKK